MVHIMYIMEVYIHDENYTQGTEYMYIVHALCAYIIGIML